MAEDDFDTEAQDEGASAAPAGSSWTPPAEVDGPPPPRSDLKGVGPKGAELLALSNKGYKTSGFGNTIYGNVERDENKWTPPAEVDGPPPEEEGMLSSFGKSFARGLGAPAANTLRGVSDIVDPLGDKKQSGAYKVAADIESALNWEQSDKSKQSIAGQAGEIAGNLAGTIAPIAAAGLLAPEGAAAAVGIGGMALVGGAGGAHSAHETAEAFGASDGIKIASTEAGGVAGGVVGGFMGAINKLLPQLQQAGATGAAKVLQKAQQAGLEGGAFTGLGIADRAAQDVIQQTLIDPNAEGHQDLKSAITDFGLGALFSLLHGAPPAKPGHGTGVDDKATEHSPNSNVTTVGNASTLAKPPDGRVKEDQDGLKTIPPKPGSQSEVPPEGVAALNTDPTVAAVAEAAGAKEPNQPGLTPPGMKPSQQAGEINRPPPADLSARGFDNPDVLAQIRDLGEHPDAQAEQFQQQEPMRVGDRTVAAHKIIDTQTGEVVGNYGPGRTAFKKALHKVDALDQQYGAARYKVKTIYEEGQQRQQQGVGSGEGYDPRKLVAPSGDYREMITALARHADEIENAKKTGKPTEALDAQHKEMLQQFNQQLALSPDAKGRVKVIVYKNTEPLLPNGRPNPEYLKPLVLTGKLLTPREAEIENARMAQAKPHGEKHKRLDHPDEAWLGDEDKIKEDLLHQNEKRGVRVMMLDKANIARSGANARGGEAWFDPASNTIFLRDDGAHEVGTQGKVLTFNERTYWHELVHGAVTPALLDNPRLADATKAIMSVYLDHYGPEHIVRNRHQYAFSNEHEFHTEATTKRGLQKDLSEVKLPDALAEAIGMNDVPLRDRPFYTLWQGLVEITRRLLGLQPHQFTALEGLMKIQDDLKAHQLSSSIRAGFKQAKTQHERETDLMIGPKGRETLDKVDKRIAEQNQGPRERSGDRAASEREAAEREAAAEKEAAAEIESNEPVPPKPTAEEVPPEITAGAERVVKEVDERIHPPEETEAEEPAKPAEPPPKGPEFGRRPPEPERPARRPKPLRGPILHFLQDATHLVRKHMVAGFAKLGDDPWTNMLHHMFSRSRLAREHLADFVPLLRKQMALGKADREGQAQLDHVMKMATRASMAPHLTLDEQMHPDEQRLTKNSWRVARHPEIVKEYEKLSQAHKDWLTKEWYPKTEKVLKDSTVMRMVNSMKDMGIKGIDHEAIARRMFEGYPRTGDHNEIMGDQEKADRKALGPHFDLYKSMAEHGRKPWYAPLNNGDGYYTVNAKVKPVLEGGERDVSKEVDPKWAEGDRRTFAFDSAEKAQKFMSKQHLEPEHTVRIIDPDYPNGRLRTGSLDANGEWHKYEPRDREINPALQEEHLVRVRNQYYSEHATEHEQRTRAHDLKKTGDYEDGTVRVSVKRWRQPFDPAQLGHEFERALSAYRKSKEYLDMAGDEKAQAAGEAALRRAWQEMLASTQAPHMERTGAAGANNDINANLYSWAQRASHELAGMETAHNINQELKRQHDIIKRGYEGEDPQLVEDREKARRQMTNTLINREYHSRSGQDADIAPWLRNLVTASYLKHLATPAFAIKNLTQYPMLTMQAQGAEFGQFRTMRVAFGALKDMGVWNLVKETARGFKLAAQNRGTEASFSQALFKGIKFRDDAERNMFDKITKNGRVDDMTLLPLDEMGGGGQGKPTNADLFPGSEKHKMREAINMAGDMSKLGMSYAEGFARMLPSATETFNRGLTALTEWRLAMKKHNGDEAKAFDSVLHRLNSTQVSYDKVGLAPWMKTPIATPFVQFKRFGGAMYSLFGGHIANIITSHPEGSEPRIQSAKALGYFALSHFLIAGAAGLPWEPPNLMLMAAKQLGLNDKDWDYVVGQMHFMFAKIAKSMGADPHTAAGFAKVMTYGLPSLLGIDLNQGLGLQNIIAGNGPKSGTEREKDDNMWAYLGKSIFGSTGGMTMDMLHGAREATTDPLDAFKKMVPFKILGDIAGTIHDAGGKKDARGKQITKAPSGYENVMKIMGFPLINDTEGYARYRYAKGVETRAADDHGKLLSAWMSASPANKAAAAREAMKGGVTMKEYSAALSRQQKQRNVNDVPVSKRNQAQLARELPMFDVPRVRGGN